MINVEEYFEWFKQIFKDFQKISKRFKKYKEKLHGIEGFQSECLIDLELAREN